MKTLLFLRHAHAEDALPHQLDIDRCLSQKGRKQAKVVASYVRQQLAHISPQLVLTSPYPRALQTTAIVANRIVGKDSMLDAPQVLEVEALALETEALTLLDWLQPNWAQLPAVTLLVSHEPNISNYLAVLLGGHAGGYVIKKASLTAIAVTERFASSHESAIHGQLLFSLPQRLMASAIAHP